MLGIIKMSQADEFKKGYVKEMQLVISFLNDKIKNGESLSEEDANEAKEILCSNVDKFKELD